MISRTGQGKALFWGIDLTCSPARPSACIGLDGELTLAFCRLLNDDAELVAAVEQHRPSLIAIDAPLNLPRGLCCLEPECSCRPRSAASGRSCERELARLGIPCYFTTKRSIIKPMVRRAIGLKAELAGRGYQVIEVYPYATKVRLFGKPIPPKRRPLGLIFLRVHLAMLLPFLIPHLGAFNHDLCDGALAAYTAYLYRQGRAELIGQGEEGLICLPIP